MFRLQANLTHVSSGRGVSIGGLNSYQQSPRPLQFVPNLPFSKPRLVIAPPAGGNVPTERVAVSATDAYMFPPPMRVGGGVNSRNAGLTSPAITKTDINYAGACIAVLNFAVGFSDSAATTAGGEEPICPRLKRGVE